MPIAEGFLWEFDHEMATTRRLLERLPEDRLDWKPHAKSRTLGELATHVTELPRWGMRSRGTSFQVGSEPAPPLRTVADYLTRFDANVAESREALEQTADEAMREEFTVFRPNGEVFFQVKRRALFRLVLLNHLIHHRGQLTVYLRENEVPLTPIYGPTADGFL